MKNTGFQKERRSHTVLTVVFAIIAVAYLYPIFIVLVNSLKTNAAINLDTFAFPTSNTFMGLQNYIKGMTFGNCFPGHNNLYGRRLHHKTARDADRRQTVLYHVCISGRTFRNADGQADCLHRRGTGKGSAQRIKFS